MCAAAARAGVLHCRRRRRHYFYVQVQLAHGTGGDTYGAGASTEQWPCLGRRQRRKTLGLWEGMLESPVYRPPRTYVDAPKLES